MTMLQLLQCNKEKERCVFIGAHQYEKVLGVFWSDQALQFSMGKFGFFDSMRVYTCKREIIL
jgi:hypothetical protein